MSHCLADAVHGLFVLSIANPFRSTVLDGMAFVHNLSLADNRERAVDVRLKREDADVTSGTDTLGRCFHSRSPVGDATRRLFSHVSALFFMQTLSDPPQNLIQRSKVEDASMKMDSTL